MDAADSRYKKQSAGDELLDSFLSAMAISEGKSVHPLETFEEYSRNNGAFTEMVSQPVSDPSSQNAGITTVAALQGRGRAGGNRPRHFGGGHRQPLGRPAR